MSWDPDLQNNSQAGKNPYTVSGYEKAKIRNVILIVLGILLTFIIVIAIIPESQQTKYTNSATAAARKKIPDAKVSNVKVAGGFAIAIVSDPSAQGQANSGNTTIFKVNKDGSMVQIASGSSFSPIDLLGLGIPLATQAQLTGSDLTHVKLNLEIQCGYSDGLIGYTGFDASFNPNGWQIDSATLSGLEQKLSNAVNNQNANLKPGTKVICINATRKNSNDSINQSTYISTFTLQVRFITDDGTLTTHTVTFSLGPKHYRNYSLDGHDIN